MPSKKKPCELRSSARKKLPQRQGRDDHTPGPEKHAHGAPSPALRSLPRLVRTYIVRATRSCCTSRRRKKGSKYGITAHVLLKHRRLIFVWRGFSLTWQSESPEQANRRETEAPWGPAQPPPLLKNPPPAPPAPCWLATADDDTRRQKTARKTVRETERKTERKHRAGRKRGGHRNEKGKSGSKRWLARFRMRTYIGALLPAFLHSVVVVFTF